MWGLFVGGAMERTNWLQLEVVKGWGQKGWGGAYGKGAGPQL